MTCVLRRRLCALGAVALFWGGTDAGAQEASAGDWHFDSRLRYETVDQDGLRDADALTYRARLGYQSPAWHGFTGLIEVEGLADLAGDYNDTVNGRTDFAIIADPETLELNRLHVAWAGEEGQRATLGRQRIVLGNARFVGNVGFRQNEQTFDAVRLEAPLTARLSLSYVYLDRVRRVFGDDSPQGEWDSDSHVVAADVQAPFGQIGAYALLLDFQNAPAQASQTYGLRWSHEWTGEALRPRITLETARQSDYRNNSAAFDLNYHLAEFTARRGSTTARLGWEQLNGDGTRGFATPLATLHTFQGWADVFLNTPADGVRDLYAGLTHTIATRAGDGPLTLALAAHRFSDAGGGTGFGHELNASARFSISPRAAVEIKAAAFESENLRFADRTKTWLTLEASF